MNTTEKQLYTITNESDSEADAQAAEKALSWLLSKDADGIGNDLLLKSYQLHKQPLKIIISSDKENAYIDDEYSKHTLYINPSYIRGMSAEDSGKRATIEQVLAHEMLHSTQAIIKLDKERVAQARAESRAKFQGTLSPEESAKRNSLIVLAVTAQTYEESLNHITRYVDEFGINDSKKVTELFNAHPYQKQHVEKFENPAMEVENEIARLSGGAIRTTEYAHSLKIEEKSFRKNLIDELVNTLEIQNKPRANEQQKIENAAIVKKYVNKQGGRNFLLH